MSDTYSFALRIEEKVEKLTFVQTNGAGKLVQLIKEDIAKLKLQGFYKFDFLPVLKPKPKGGESGKHLLAITVQRLVGGAVFTKMPECPIVDGHRVRQTEKVEDWCKLATDCVNRS